MIALSEREQKALKSALMRNAADDGAALLMARDTSFAGIVKEQDWGPNCDAQVIDAVKGIPSHY